MTLALTKLRNESTAILLTAIFLTHMTMSGFKAGYDLLVRQEPKKQTGNHKLLSAVIPAVWVSQIPDKNEYEAPARKLGEFLHNNREAFRDIHLQLQQTLLSTELALFNIPGFSLSFQKKLALLARACDHTDPAIVKKTLSTLSALSVRAQLGRIDENHPNFSEHLSFLLEQSLIEDSFLSVSDIQNLTEKYQATFGKTREAAAMETYEKTLLQEEESVTEIFKSFVRHVLEGTFSEARMETKNNIHLRKIKRNNAGLFEKWKQPSLPTALRAKKTDSQSISLESFFQRKLQDGHWGKEENDVLPRLTAFVCHPDQRRSLMEQEDPSSPEYLCMQLFFETDPGKQKITAHAAVNALKDTFSESLPAIDEFLHDLEGLTQEIPSQKEKLSVVDTNDWQDLFLCGTEVAGSCQRIDGNPMHNKCLLAYVLDGKNRMIAVKDSSGRVLARSIFRLLWDSVGKKPVLFLDRIYPDPCPSGMKQALIDHAKRRAQELGTTLLSCDEPGPSYQGSVESLGSSCPYEYADHGGGFCPKGEFSILNAKEIPPVVEEERSK